MAVKLNKVFLLADDDSDDRSLFSEALGQLDSSIICYCVTDGKQALELMSNKENELPGIIFLDVNMPIMTGWECLTELKKIDAYKDIPVFIYSTSAHQKEINISLDLGAFCFFTKPSDFVELKDILKLLSGNLNGNLKEAVTNFNDIKSKRVFAF